MVLDKRVGEYACCCGQCKSGDYIVVHGVVGLKNCIIVVAKCIFENFEKFKFFSPNPFIEFFNDCVGFSCFWPVKDVSLTIGLWEKEMDSNVAHANGITRRRKCL